MRYKAIIKTELARSEEDFIANVKIFDNFEDADLYCTQQFEEISSYPALVQTFIEVVD